MYNTIGWVAPFGLAGCLSHAAWKRLRTDVYNAQRPSAKRHAAKHINAKPAEPAKELSLGKGTLDLSPEASYLPAYASKVAGFEKQAAYGAIRNGHVFDHSGTRFIFMFYKKTNWCCWI